ncbi:HNH endonuclease [Paenibacillus sp. FSL k6-2145]|uniref:HNH endonuclease n=1 Tax=Paenibacillus TaxID=44249 RepID=UPI001F0E6FD2|nr:HNH endonuclease [Paenibacillus amylolyticus]UOK62307.1 HNH endonuclease [Paenibacillus sp. OVF10]
MNTWKPPTKKKDEGKLQADTKPPKSSEPEKPQESPKGTEGTGNSGSVDRTANLENIKDFAKGNKKFNEVLDDYALIYGDIVKLNKVWSWQDDFVGKLNSDQRSMIKQRALELHSDIPTIQVKKIPGLKFGYADFKRAGAVLHEDVLPKDLWKATDAVQFKWLNDRLPNKVQPEGTTWNIMKKVV